MMAAKKKPAKQRSRQAAKPRQKTLSARLVEDHTEYTRQQRVLVREMIRALHDGLSDLGVKPSSRYEGTGTLAFRLCSMLDLFTAGLDVSPHLGFQLDDGSILTAPSGSFLHELVYDEIDATLEP
jgi:hypothetical protein